MSYGHCYNCHVLHLTPLSPTCGKAVTTHNHVKNVFRILQHCQDGACDSCKQRRYRYSMVTAYWYDKVLNTTAAANSYRFQSLVVARLPAAADLPTIASTRYVRPICTLTCRLTCGAGCHPPARPDYPVLLWRPFTDPMHIINLSVQLTLRTSQPFPSTPAGKVISMFTLHFASKSK